MQPREQSDPFLFDAERLKSLASHSILRRGISYFKEDRVLDLAWDAERVWATVEGTRPGGYQVHLSLDEEGDLAVDCDCPFDWEPACKHAVATLLAYSSRQPVSEVQVEDAASEAVEARVQRGRGEVTAKHVDGDHWFGTWEARSLDATNTSRGPWRVKIRSLAEPINHCACPDFATNRLGTCKHIEAVLHRLRKRAPKKFARLASKGPPASFVHLDWEGSASPRIRLWRSAGEAGEWLAEHFDEPGYLRGSLPEAFRAFEAAARRNGGPDVTDEATQYVERLTEEEVRRERADELTDRIRASGGELPGIAARLYPYQVEGVAFLAAAGRALLADDMGLGKTLQAISAAAVLREEREARRALVVCPASLKHQWAREVQRFTGLEAAVVEGSPAARLAIYRRRAAFSIANYEILLRDAEPVQELLCPDVLILDEAQRIKNWRTKTAAAVKSFETPFAFVLTGTPLENRLEDLYSLMQVVDPRVLGPLWRYLLDFHVRDPRGKVLGYRNLAELRRRLAPVMLRREKTLVRDQLPERIDTQLDLELDRRQRDLHDEAMAMAARLGQIAEKRPLTPPEERRLMAALQRARMACNAAGLVDGETVGSPKLSELESLLEELCLDGGRKVVVFSQWERMTRMAEDLARGLGLGVVRLHGGVPSARRGKLIDRFREDPAVQVFLSTDAGGVGLNLQAASVLINLDLPWNPAVLEQRIGRVHRLGQKEPVQVVRMVSRGSYEARVEQLLASKQELFRNVMSEEANEDAVGISRRMVEMALSSLGEVGDEAESADASLGEATAPETEEALEATTPDSGESSPDPAAENKGSATKAATADESLAPVIARLQEALGDRIERVEAMCGGLVVVLDSVDPSAEAQASAAGGELDLAVLDARSWSALSRLGPIRPPQPAESPLPSAASRAERKLAAARLLAREGHHGEVGQLATTAMLHAAASAAGMAEPPPVQRAAVWIHAELVPAGSMGPDDAARISRALALADAGDLPPELAASLLHDAEALVRSLAVAEGMERRARAAR